MPPDLNFENLGVSITIAVLLLWALKLAVAKIDKQEIKLDRKDATIQELNDRHIETLVTSLSAQNKSISTLDRAMEFINREVG